MLPTYPHPQALFLPHAERENEPGDEAFCAHYLFSTVSLLSSMSANRLDDIVSGSQQQLSETLEPNAILEVQSVRKEETLEPNAILEVQSVREKE